MKQKILLSLFCLASLFLCVSCSDDDEQVIVVDPNDLLFQVDELARTTTTYTFRIKSSDDKTPYLCLYVDKGVIDQVPREQLHTYLFDDLKKQAEAKGEDFTQFLSKITHVGDIPELKLTGLLQGKMYELVLFGLNGTEIAKKPFCHFFETAKADMISCKFDVEVSATLGNVTIAVSPENKETKWYGGVLEKRYYDANRDKGLDDLNILAALFNQDLERVLSQLAPDGMVTEEIIDMALEQLLIQGDAKFGMNTFNGLLADTDYVWMGVAIYVTPDYELLFVSESTKVDFHSEAAAQKDVTFNLDVKKTTKTHAHFTITPSDLKQAYVWRCEPYNPTTEKMTPEELARHIIATNPWIFFEARPHGVVTYPGQLGPKGFKLTPGTKHYLTAFGFEGGVCTEVYRQDVEPAPAGDPQNINFEVKVLDKTSDEVALEIIPSDESVFYMPLLYPSSEDKEVIKGRLMSGFNKQLAQTVQSLDPYATIWNIIAQNALLGNHQLSWSNVKPGEKMTLLMLTFDKKGIASDKDLRMDFLTIPGLSPETKVGNMKVYGVFDGDAENGDVFNDPYVTRGKAIIAMGFECTPDVTRAFSSVGIDEIAIDELDPEMLPDSEIMDNNSMYWTPMDIKRPYQFLVADWGSANITYTFGTNQNGERGPIARAVVPTPSLDKVDDIQKLKDLVTELNKPDSRALSSSVSLVNSQVIPWSAYKREVNLEDCIGKPLNQSAEEVLRVPFRPANETRAAETKLPVLRVATFVPVANPV